MDDDEIRGWIVLLYSALDAHLQGNDDEAWIHLNDLYERLKTHP